MEQMEQRSNENETINGNTSYLSCVEKNRNFAFTLFYEGDEQKARCLQIIDRLKGYSAVVDLVYQEEKAPSTGRLHFQGCVMFKNGRRLLGVKELFAPLQPHVEVCRKSWSKNVGYCTKERTRAADGVSESYVKKDPRCAYADLRKKYAWDDNEAALRKAELAKYPNMRWDWDYAGTGYWNYTPFQRNEESLKLQIEEADDYELVSFEDIAKINKQVEEIAMKYARMAPYGGPDEVVVPVLK